MTKLMYRSEVYPEGDQFVGYCPELNVSSFGDTPQEAHDSLHEAVEAFLEGCEMIGSLQEVLEESGFLLDGDTWRRKGRIVEERIAVLS